MSRKILDISSGQFSVKLQEEMYDAVNGYCVYKDCIEKVSEFHHKLANTEVNRKKFPLFLSSPFNMWPCCRKHHVDGNRPKVRDSEAIIFEKHLEKLKESSNE